MGKLKENLINIKEMISESAKKSGRKPESVSLIGVSKTQSIDKIKELSHYGVKIFGESRVQEALPKIAQLNDSEIKFHFIGGLQTNKIKDVVGKFNLIQSVDRENLINTIDKIACMKGLVQDILIQVNVAYEKQKGGVSKENLDELIDKTIVHNNIRLKGFMLIPPFHKSPEHSRRYFSEMYQIFERYKPSIQSINTLSMGMSGDFQIAIEEGATHVRIGTSLFGER